MPVRQPRYSREEIAQRGTEIYERDIRPHVETGNDGKIVAIDVGTGAYELGEEIVTTSDRLLARCPDAQIWFVRVGHPAVYRIGRISFDEAVIIGSVNTECEAIISLEVVDASGQPRAVEAVIDTGFTGFLTLPPLMIALHGLVLRGHHQVILGDGSVSLLDVYVGTVVWDGQPCLIDIDSADTDPLVGMSLLDGYALYVEVRAGAGVTIPSW
jgi:clan AA aspartic protease